VVLTKKVALWLTMEWLQKKLEMSELLLLQFSSRSEATESNQQLQLAMEVQPQLETRGETDKVLKQLQLESKWYKTTLG
jgi:hypothetical protein